MCKRLESRSTETISTPVEDSPNRNSTFVIPVLDSIHRFVGNRSLTMVLVNVCAASFNRTLCWYGFSWALHLHFTERDVRPSVPQLGARATCPDLSGSCPLRQGRPARAGGRAAGPKGGPCATLAPHCLEPGRHCALPAGLSSEIPRCHKRLTLTRIQAANAFSSRVPAARPITACVASSSLAVKR